MGVTLQLASWVVVLLVDLRYFQMTFSKVIQVKEQKSFFYILRNSNLLSFKCILESLSRAFVIIKNLTVLVEIEDKLLAKIRD